jgi:8-oxo-dGTP diphosphatase
MAQDNTRAYVHVYLLLVQGDKLLFSLRQNTGYEDGKYSLVAGHVETGESAKQACVREAKEEIGIHIDPSDLEVVHTMHRRSDRECIDIFLFCDRWKGQVANQEPQKCGGVQFFSKIALPDNLVGYVREALKDIDNNVVYSEFGW